MNDGELSSDEAEDHKEYLALLAIFQQFIRKYADEEDRWDLLEALMSLRAEFLINHAVRGFGKNMDEALELIRKKKGLSKEEKEQRKILLAALDNLVDFAVVEEFQMYDELPKEFNPDNSEDIQDLESICRKYNDIYANIENGDVVHAMLIAAWWAARSEMTVFTYMTQGDERVRPWHRALEGLSYPKRTFPAWLVPPIEHGCRCYLVEESMDTVSNKLEDVQAESDDIPDFVNPVFVESVAQGGRIFGPAHSYFTIPRGYKRKLKTISKRIKASWLKG